MCGIAGWFSTRPVTADDAPRLEAMMARLAHRGPDGRGTLFTGHAAFGHARLAIIDLAGGTQPMQTDDGALSIIFNGEIYNFLELRQQLTARGAQFRTRSDTEVILRIYEHDGWQGFSRMRGMYAFALWDARTQTGWLVRDPCGIKPLFVKSVDGSLRFASEAKAILATDADKAELDEDALHLLLNFRYLPGERSLFRGITQLAPGTAMSWRPDGSCAHHPLPSLPTSNDNRDVLQSLEDSVRAHFIADVEVGAYLSGGVDSAAIVALAKRSGYDRVRTFTLDIGDDPQEAANAARTAELLGVENIRESPANIDQALPRVIWHLEVPKINALQVHHLACEASRHVKVTLSGLGGDELFFGYNAHRIMHRASDAQRLLPQWASRASGAAAAALLKHLPGPMWSEAERSALMLQSLGAWHRVYGLLRNVWDQPALRQKIYGPRLLDAKLSNAFDVLETHWPNDRDPVTAMAKFEWRQKMVNDLLWQEDRLSMAQSLEARVPFVDVTLKQHVDALSRSELMPAGQPKAYMRKMLSSLLPQEILNRRKSGFQVDAPTFFHRHLAPLADRLLSDDYVRQAGLFNPSFVRAIRRYAPQQKLRWHYFMLYLMLGTHLWLEIFEKQSWQAPK